MNRIVPLLLLGILLILIGGFFLIYHEKDTPLWTFNALSPTSSSYDEVQELKKKQIEIDSKSYNTAIAAKDPNLCESIGDTVTKSRCHDMSMIAKAVESGDKNLCTNLSGTGMTAQCQDNVTYHLAETSKDVKYCQGIIDENIRKGCDDAFTKSSAMVAIASGKLSSGDCDTFSNEEERNQCHNRLIAETDMRTYRAAQEQKDREMCNSIKSEELKNQCSDTLLLEVALSRSDAELCVSIIDQDRKEYCQRTILARSDVTRYQDIIRNGDLNACKSLTTPEMEQQCHDTIVFSQVRTTQDDTLCATLYSTGIIDRCHAMIRKQ